MNGGAPAAALRSVRVSPVLVDDLAPSRALRRPIVGAPPELDLVRWARAWLVGWQAALHHRAVIGHVEAWTVALSQAEWPTLKGDPERHRQHAAASLLLRMGLAESGDVHGVDGPVAPGACRAGPPLAVRLTEAAFVQHRAGLELDWAVAYEACRAEPAALLVLRGVVDCLPVLDDAGPITLRELAARTGYGEKQVRVGLHRLVSAGVLATRDAPGQPTRYRVTPALLGRGEAGTTRPPVARGPRPYVDGPPADPARSSVLHASTPDAGASMRAAKAVEERAPAFRLTLNGATLALAAGLTANVRLDADGVPHLHVSGAPRTERDGSPDSGVT